MDKYINISNLVTHVSEMSPSYAVQSWLRDYKRNVFKKSAGGEVNLPRGSLLLSKCCKNYQAKESGACTELYKLFSFIFRLT